MKNFDRYEFESKLQDIIGKLNRYKVVIVMVLILAVYGFVFWRITSLNNVQPSTSSVTAQANPLAGARVDKQTVSQLESLRDNSVNVQSLFDQERNNPFQ